MPDIKDLTIGAMLRQAEALGAGSVSVAYRDGEDAVEWACVVIRGEGAAEMYAAWEAAETALQDRWAAEDGTTPVAMTQEG